MTDRYEIIKLISKDPAGGMYLAQDTTLERKVVFRHIDADHQESRSETWSKEFSTFSGKLCALQHPNLLTIYDVAVDEDGVSMVTQYVEGESLAERLEHGPLRQMGAFRMASDLLEGLHAAHESGVFHGALHTGSVKRLPRATGGHRYLLVDLGLNTLATMVKGEDVNIADPVLLAPELHDEKSQPDVRADLFMLGQLCYTALAGGHPFAEESPEECARAHQAGELPPLVEFAPDVQPDFSNWVMHLASGDRDQRPKSIKEAMQSLHEITIDEPEPNIPGETHAVVAAIANSPIQQTPVVVAEQAQAPPQVLDYATVDKSSNNKVAMTIVSLCVLIIAGLLFGLLRDGGNSEDDQEGGGLTAVPEGVSAYMHQVELVNTMANRKEPVEINLETEKTLDWIVFTGAPASSKRVEKDAGQFIQSIFSVGSFKEFAMKNVPVKFKANDKEIVPKAATDSKKGHGAKLNDGWEIMLRVPKKHKGSAIVNLYMVQWHCDFKITLTMADGKEVISFDVPKQDPGAVKIPLEIPDPKPGGFYGIKIVATSSDPKEGYSMGVNAIQVESR